METFVPLYISNKCDSYCTMCNFNCMNESLHRIEATIPEIEEQLKIIYDYEKIKAVCILTGEMFLPEARWHNIELVCNAMNKAFEIGFQRVFFNIGSLKSEEIDYIYENVQYHDEVVLSLFQETYDKKYYKEHFGIHPKYNAKADYQNRLSTIDRWIDHGLLNVDLGVLLGFKPVEADVECIIEHANRCIRRGAIVYISTPRMKNGIVDDNEYLAILNKIHEKVPTAKLIITTREKIDFINRVLDIISVISPGSSDICPYKRKAFITNDITTSQFVIDNRRMRPYDVLKLVDFKGKIKYFID